MFQYIHQGKHRSKEPDSEMEIVPHKFKIYRSKDKSIPFFYDIQFI
ncbi:hypothetical protein LEP1GSC055_2507 [Leptospira borgpetersenii str. Brem 307]|uniref:Uncharacterized protein n=1 Tax=Leptospira borgpetersenii str. Brem 328 TaxID=1049780 RepID=A0ABC9SLW6_LEPBO|nr:hypothetical protein LEP1GSC055_2507 [Leptospira borgpetersenii str. Brem 307]EMN18637.1 hypothetical protein LEP1GSC056_2165 [Leptospira borgpetersenii str. Brem 328]